MLDSMKAYLETSGVSRVSLLSYGRDLQRLSEAFGAEAETVSREKLCDYFAEAGKVLSPTSLSRHFSVLRSYYQFLADRGVRTDHPMTALSASRFYEKEGVMLTREDFQRLLGRTVPGFRGMRDRAMISLLLETGLRISELCGLDREDVGERSITCGAGERLRTLPLSPTLSTFLERYLALSALYLSESGGERALFITSAGKRMTRQAVWKNLKDHVVLCGIDKNVSPQVLRRSFAHMQLEEKVDRDALRRFLGNADTASLRSYQIRRKKDV